MLNILNALFFVQNRVSFLQMKLNLKHILFLIIPMVLLSCSTDDELPKDIIPENEMVNVLTEIELTQALIKLKFSDKDTLVNQTQLFNEVYTEHNTSEEQFNKSLDYYSKQPKVLDSIYVRVVTKLSEKQAKEL
jgi:uncharacterized protein DUF4296